MLEEIRITSLGVIAEATLPLSPGLTVVTGETGAGKTMVVTALGLLFGGRADVSRVRGGSEKAVVEGRLRVDVSNPVGAAIATRVSDAGGALDDDDGQPCVALVRTVTTEGRSRAHVGGRSAPVSVLTEIGELAVMVHGQSDQARLLQPTEQRAALDRYAGDPVTELLETHRDLFRRWRDLCDELAERTSRARELAQEADALRFGISEIESVDPQPGEDDALRAESNRLENAEALRLAAFTAHAALVGDPDTTDGGDPADVSALLGVVRASLSGPVREDPDLAAYSGRADEIAALVAELAADLASYNESLDSDPARLSAVHERRAQLSTLTRKYADTIDGVLSWAQEAGSRLSTLDVSEEALSALRAEKDAVEAALVEVATKLSAVRAEVATGFAAAVTTELTGLAMPHAQVEVMLGRRPAASGQPSIRIDGDELAISPDGIDEVELRLIAHPGAPSLPLQRGASGGELSRVMLAVEVVFAGAGGPMTMVFDEVDAGVGGRAAVEVGRRLARLARSHQVLVVTHLPQVAAFADRHLTVVKDNDGSVTTSGVQMLSADERPRELARMLAGMEGSHLGVAHAEELLALARVERSREKAPATRRRRSDRAS